MLVEFEVRGDGATKIFGTTDFLKSDVVDGAVVGWGCLGLGDSQYSAVCTWTGRIPYYIKPVVAPLDLFVQIGLLLQGVSFRGDGMVEDGVFGNGDVIDVYEEKRGAQNRALRNTR